MMPRMKYDLPDVMFWNYMLLVFDHGLIYKNPIYSLQEYLDWAFFLSFFPFKRASNLANLIFISPSLKFLEEQ